MSKMSLFTNLDTCIHKKLLVLLFYVIVILGVYYLAVCYLNYPYAKEAVVSLFVCENIFRQAFGEEVVYRLLPLMAVISLFGTNKFALTIVIISMSTYFALGHLGLKSLIPIGFSGIVLSIIFLQFGGYKKQYLQGLLWSGFAHSLANFSIFVFIPAIFFS
jgi:hypothetical protein